MTGHTIVQAVDSLGHDPHVVSSQQLGVELESEGVTVSPDVDVLVNWRIPDCDGTSLATHALLRAAAFDVPVVNPADGVTAAASKLSSAAAIADAGGAIPRTWYSPSPQGLAARRETFDDVVQKPTFNGCGTDVHKLTADDAVRVLPREQRGLLQTPIETPGTHHWDVRAFVVDGEVVAAMKRTAAPGEWLTNITQGGQGEPYDLDASEADLAVTATDALGLDAAGVDLLQDTDGNWYVLEVNAPAGIRGITDATGVNPAAHIAALAIRRGGGDVPDAHVAALADQLNVVETSEAWANRADPPQPSFRMRVESEGECAVVGEDVTPVSAVVDTEREHSLVRASAVESCRVDVVGAEMTDVGGTVQTRPLARVPFAAGDLIQHVKCLLVEDENKALTADVVLAPGAAGAGRQQPQD